MLLLSRIKRNASSLNGSPSDLNAPIATVAILAGLAYRQTFLFQLVNQTCHVALVSNQEKRQFAQRKPFRSQRAYSDGRHSCRACVSPDLPFPTCQPDLSCCSCLESRETPVRSTEALPISTRL